MILLAARTADYQSFAREFLAKYPLEVACSGDVADRRARIKQGQIMELNVNGAGMNVTAADDTPLLWALRDHLGLTGTKFGCGMALCGACTVHVDGEPTRACVTPLSAVAGKKIVTIEGVSATQPGRVLQEAWIQMNVPQCGYCQSGQIMSAAALLTGNQKPSDSDIDSAMTGNICRCGTYPRIRAAIKRAAGQLEKKP
jgi:isoquinoline 1-oxidoreductase alpha subunit